jgi:hypothetical protein
MRLERRPGVNGRADFSFIDDFRLTLSEAVNENPELLSGADFVHTMDVINDNWSYLSEQTGAMYYDDLGGENILLADDQVFFVDLESVWAGNVTLQVGALVANFAQWGNPESLDILTRLLSRISELLHPNWDAWMAAAYLKIWLRICRFHRWNRWKTRGHGTN